MSAAAETRFETPQTDACLPPALYVLTVSTGFIDAVSYLGLGKVFTANVTGNVVLLGFGVAGAGGLPTVAPLVSLGAFLVGAVVSGRLATAHKGRHPVVFRRALVFEIALVACATIVVAATTVDPDTATAYTVIAFLACAMGARTAMIRALDVRDLRTTALTMTLTGLAADSPLAGGTGRRSWFRLGAAAALFGGALVGALLEQQSLLLALAVVLASGAATLVGYSAARARAAGRGAQAT